jgi:hypothetical protein
MVERVIKIAKCCVGLTYEGINKFLVCDLILEDGYPAKIVFEWEIQLGRERAKTWYQVPIHDLQSTEENLYSLQTTLDVDLAPPTVRADLLKNCF